MTLDLSTFYPGTRWRWTWRLTNGGVPVDIRADTLTLYLKVANEPDSEAALVAVGDVATNGINGEVIFDLPASQTKIASRSYFAELVWRPGGNPEQEEIVYKDSWSIPTRVTDM